MLIGGELDASFYTLNAGLGDENMKYCYQPDHRHGETVVAKGLDAWSVPCEVRSTSKCHRMVVVLVAHLPAAVITGANKPAIGDATQPDVNDEDWEMG